MSAPDAELKPCPFCNSHVSCEKNEDGWRIGCCQCIAWNKDKVTCKLIWNTAHCWKRIAALEAENQKLRESVEKLFEAGKGYFGNGCEPTDGDIVHQSNHCRQCRLKEALSDYENSKGGKG